MNNYQFCAQWVVDQAQDRPVRVLDYGCGAGAIVQELRRRNVSAFGCDVFYGGGDYSKKVPAELRGEAIRAMHNGEIPFEDGEFDFVINNQVMEHVENLDDVLREVHRVLKPGGMVLSLFPDAGVWREGHCGIPFLHWFPKRSRARVYYAAALRTLGAGSNKGDKSVMRWSVECCNWLDNWTHYRERSEIERAFARDFVSRQHIEDYYLRERLGDRLPPVKYAPASALRLVVRKFGGLVFVVRKQKT